jgi:hypothetical protein
MPRPKRRRVKGHGSVYKKDELDRCHGEGSERRSSHGYPTQDLAEKVRAQIAADLAAGRGGLPKKLAPRSLPALPSEIADKCDPNVSSCTVSIAAYFAG